MNCVIWLQDYKTIINRENNIEKFSTINFNIKEYIEKNNIKNVLIAKSGYSKFLNNSADDLGLENIYVKSDIEVFTNMYGQNKELIAILSYGSCFGFYYLNEIKRIGGYGYLLDDLGSIYYLGKRLIKELIIHIENDHNTEFVVKSKDYFNYGSNITRDLIYKIYNSDEQYIINYALIFLNSTDEFIINFFYQYCEEIIDYMYKLVRKYNLSKIKITGDLLMFPQIRSIFEEINLIEVVEYEEMKFESYYE